MLPDPSSVAGHKIPVAMPTFQDASVFNDSGNRSDAAAASSRDSRSILSGQRPIARLPQRSVVDERIGDLATIHRRPLEMQARFTSIASIVEAGWLISPSANVISAMERIADFLASVSALDASRNGCVA